jgi:hypothetical protein
VLKNCEDDELLKELKESDIIPLRSDMDSVVGAPARPREDGLGEGYCSVSWIWMQSGRDGTQEGESAEGVLFEVVCCTEY